MIDINRLITVIGMLSLISVSSCIPTNSLIQEKSVTQSQLSTPPKSNLPPLQLGSYLNQINLFDSLYQKGGTSSVIKWVEQELQPGRQIILDNDSSQTDDEMTTIIIYDRAIWNLNDQGKATDEALLAPINPEGYLNPEVGFWTWTPSNPKFTIQIQGKKISEK